MTELSDYQQEILNDMGTASALAMNINADRLIDDCWTRGMSLDETQDYVLNGSGLLVDRCVILEAFDGLDAEYVLAIRRNHVEQTR
jgi:hypothetical protein